LGDPPDALLAEQGTTMTAWRGSTSASWFTADAFAASST
jgi:hypothetical protein